MWTTEYEQTDTGKPLMTGLRLNFRQSQAVETGIYIGFVL